MTALVTLPILLPLLGACVFVLLALTWATSAGDLLADR